MHSAIRSQFPSQSTFRVKLSDLSLLYLLIQIFVGFESISELNKLLNCLKTCEINFISIVLWITKSIKRYENVVNKQSTSNANGRQPGNLPVSESDRREAIVVARDHFQNCAIAPRSNAVPDAATAAQHGPALKSARRQQARPAQSRGHWPRKWAPSNGAHPEGKRYRRLSVSLFSFGKGLI